MRVAKLKKRCAGVLLHVSSLPGAYGIGDMGSASYSFVDESFKEVLRTLKSTITGIFLNFVLFGGWRSLAVSSICISS